MAFMVNPGSTSRLSSLSALFAVIFLVAGCGDQNGDADDRIDMPAQKPDRPTDTPSKGNKLPALDDLSPGWTRLEPGGKTVCANGSPYAFFVRPGTVNRVLLYFGGGGACFSQETCKKAGVLYTAKAPKGLLFKDETEELGVFDRRNPQNPFKDWTHVYVTYCTGDVHWGDHRMMYDDAASATIEHKGAVNTRAVLSWLYANVKEPEKVFVTGCSAGAYGAILWSAHVREHYESAKIYQLGDSGAGIVTEEFLKHSFPSWNAAPAYPTWIPGLDPERLTSLSSLYRLIGNHHTDMSVAQYSMEDDREQARRYRLMGGVTTEWSEKMKASFKDIASKTSTFHYYLAPGDQHCITPRSDFYSLEVCGTKVVDWVSDQVNDRPVTSINVNECPMP